MSLLSTGDLCVTFGGLRAVDRLELRVDAGQLVGLIGPNGAGKTTAIDAITGFVPSTGTVTFAGRDISEWSPHARARHGLARTWQSLELFDDLTVAENLLVAAEPGSWRQVAADLVVPQRATRTERVIQHLERVGIAEFADHHPNEVSQGVRKLIGVARALAAQPALVCMDEPAAGLNPDESERLGEQMRAIVQTGCAILLVDHDIDLVMRVCDRLYVIEFGRLIAEGSPAEVARDPRVIEAYLGRPSDSDSSADVGEASS